MVPFRVLFVDDEPNILQGLRRMLYPMRREWQMEFTVNGHDALARLAQRPFDAVVSDMRMPGMDGADLLTAVKKRHPNVVRVILSGESDQASILRSLDATHQYLSKPCDPDTLLSTLARACGVRRLLADERLQSLVSQLGALPSPPAMYLELMAECRKPDPSLQRIVDTVNADIGMTAQVLRLANSAFFGRQRRITHLLDALQILGTNTVKELVLSTQVFGAHQGAASPSFSIDQLQRYSLDVSACARMIAELERVDDQVVDDASIAGLLHDIGILVLATRLPAEWDAALEAARAGETDLAEVERSMIGASHAAVGAYLLGLWGLPDAVIEAVVYHHTPREGPRGQLTPAAIVHAADAVVQGAEANLPHAPLDMDALEEIGLAGRVEVWRAERARVLERRGA